MTPTGDTHICCGKRLKVVELHFKKTDTMTLDELFQQIHANALKLTASGPYAYPPAAGGAYGYGLDPSMMQLIQDSSHAGERAASSWIPTLTPAGPPQGALNPRFPDCWAKYSTCISSVNPFTDQRTQYCKCRNFLTICMREGLLELCSEPRY